ncbi:MAG: Toxin 1, PIN domain [Olavius algarvensis Gamma 3 endosymbiont]|nr:MAG: Toxin 1, PIN domain [Olavius algarvensis Gamma 3 endosymbiont]
MILVDSSVWIDYFNGAETTETKQLDEFLSTDTICIGDIVLAEVLQGFRSDRDYKLAREMLTELPIYQIMTPELALIGADNYRYLRKKGITIRKSVDNWIATFCIKNQISLLFSDKDFNPYVDHLNLRKP